MAARTRYHEHVRSMTRYVDVNVFDDKKDI